MEARILERLRKLRAGTTMCPGRLSVDLGSRLTELRATYLTMAREGRIEISQRGHPADPDQLKGPFRVALPDARIPGTPG